MNEFKERLNQVAVRNRLKKRVNEGHWPLDKKIEAVAAWLSLGSLKLAACKVDVPLDTVRKWKATPLWAEIVADMRTAENLKLDAKLSKLLDTAADAVLDRVENGEYIYDQKSGELKRRPAQLRDLHRVAIDSIAKRQLIRQEDQGGTATHQLTIADHLKMLAGEMAKWNKSQETKPIVLEEIEDAVYEERETGLQAGTGLGAQEEAGESGAEGGSERSPEDDDGQGSGDQR